MATMQNNPTPGRNTTADGKATKAPKSILQPKPKYNLKPALVSPEKRDVAVQQESIPNSYVQTIQKGFGENADIFTDVLQVSRDASSRDIRIAYFRRGREILAEGGFRTLDQAATVSDVSTQVRTRFQAVSMAYEIASCTRWKKYYLQNGLILADDNASVDSNDPVLGSSASVPGNAKVRWNGQVEELLFEKEPDEHEQIIKNPKKKKKRKTRVVVESGHLDEHLQKLDEEADQHFVTDFWDSLEESLDGLLRMAVPKDKKKKSRSKPRSQRKDDSSLQARGSFDSNASPKSDDRSVRSDDASVRSDDFSIKSDECSIKSDDTPFDEDPIDETVPEAKVAVPKTVSANVTPPKKEERPSPFRPISPDVSKGGSADGDMFELDSISFSGGFSQNDSDTTKKTSGRNSQAQNNIIQKEKAGPVDPSPSPKYDGEGDDIFEGLDDASNKKPVDAPGAAPNPASRTDAPRHIAVLRVRCESPATASISELTGTGVSSTVGRSLGAAASSDELDNEDGDASEASRNKYMPQNALDVIGDKCDALLSPTGLIGSLVEPRPAKEKEEEDESKDAEEAPTKKEDGFVEYLMAYISAIVHDCAGKISEFSEIEWDDTVLGAFMVDDTGVKDMLTTLETEMKKAPAIDAVEVITSPPFEAIEAVRSFG